MLSEHRFPKVARKGMRLVVRLCLGSRTFLSFFSAFHKARNSLRVKVGTECFISIGSARDFFFGLSRTSGRGLDPKCTSSGHGGAGLHRLPRMAKGLHRLHFLPFKVARRCAHLPAASSGKRQVVRLLSKQSEFDSACRGSVLT
ncbi:endonuclease/exonuclease/phosphatase family protein [Toxoplasma gondii VAND]|uniref:Uncharacterized protein n=2 Tax=Toxoplasma gondii TaxID=5811 RepID=A0A086JA80_TOXGO|nr:hypothetical protein TGP89_421160 [Toxoplasma gondii p89]KFH07359.1 endonuclease/exonuclease/phosphatase family protein [Toxoplasma gondii VAND]